MKSNTAELTFKASTIGLKTADEYRKALKEVDDVVDLKTKQEQKWVHLLCLNYSLCISINIHTI